MTPKELRSARLSFALSLSQMGKMLGYEWSTRARCQQVHEMELPESHERHRKIDGARKRLMEFYIRGIRPNDWPSE